MGENPDSRPVLSFERVRRYEESVLFNSGCLRAAFWQLLILGEAAWYTGLPPSRPHHLAIFLRSGNRSLGEYTIYTRRVLGVFAAISQQRVTDRGPGR